MNTTLDDTTLDIVTDHLCAADRVLFITGAGMSAESGLPTYRGVGGLYDGQPTEDRISIEAALSGVMLHASPELTWKYLWQIGVACHGATFNRGHAILAAMERWKPQTFVMTQNVDGLHHAAGSRNLVELHGRVSNLHCTQCPYTTTSEDFFAAVGGGDRAQTALNSSPSPALPPHCPECGGLIRPDVVLFGESLPILAVMALQVFATTPPNLIIVVGTSGVFPYITQPIVAAREAGIPTVEINPTTTHLSDLVQYRIESTAVAALESLWQRVQQRSPQALQADESHQFAY